MLYPVLSLTTLCIRFCIVIIGTKVIQVYSYHCLIKAFTNVTLKRNALKRDLF